MPSAMMRKCAKDLIEKRTLLDYGTGETVYHLQDEDRYNILANYDTSPWLAPVRKSEESTTVDLASVVVFEQKTNFRKLEVSGTPICQRKIRVPPLLL